MTFSLEDFVRESNRIEGILREPQPDEISAHEDLLLLSKITVPDLERFISIIAPNRPLRNRVGMNVSVGNHIAPEGGPDIPNALEYILAQARSGGNPYQVHREYETLHPFMDGNGRSGRALWLWMMGGIEKAPLGFLHHWYYQSLSQ